MILRQRAGPRSQKLAAKREIAPISNPQRQRVDDRVRSFRMALRRSEWNGSVFMERLTMQSSSAQATMPGHACYLAKAGWKVLCWNVAISLAALCNRGGFSRLQGVDGGLRQQLVP